MCEKMRVVDGMGYYGWEETVCRLVEVLDKSFNVNDQARIYEAIFISTHSPHFPLYAIFVCLLWDKWSSF